MKPPPIDIDRLFHALGDPTRRAILDRLVTGPTSVSRLAEPLGITLTAVSQHLQILEEVHLVHTEKLGRVRTCRIEPAGFDALDHWTRVHRTEWQRKLDRLGNFLADEDKAP
ncbi:MAG TPA: metalloregulator ArsR/SmtB family transcription factor [Terracidiphilus sp.]|jgi:DNA-binding transcriptional ArsR family regulator|nr:metalloregulator ArsR/SmtB family transcription factor [Terracidiphilus sp.]